MSSAVAHHFQHLYYLLGLYENIKKGGLVNWPHDFVFLNQTSSTQTDQINNIFGLKDFLETGKLYK